MNPKLRLAMNDWVEFDEERHQIVGFTEIGVHLRSETGARQIILTQVLLADASFRAAVNPPPLEGPEAIADPPAILAGLPEALRDKALRLEEHLLEATTGYRSGDPLAALEGEPHEAYHPDKPLDARITAKAAELGLEPRSVWRYLDQWRDTGLWALVDKRKARIRNPLAKLDPRVIQAIRDQAAHEKLSSSSTITGAFYRRTLNRFRDEHGASQEQFPNKDAFRRAVDLLLDRRPSDPAYQRASAANQPDRPFGNVIATRPGEVVMMDSTPLDVMAYDAETDSTGRVELTVALDLATRSILAWRLTPESTKAVDIGLLLMDVMTPELMRPGWADVLHYRTLSIPYERIVESDERLEAAAARPVIYPECILFDHGKAYKSDVVKRFCRKYRIDMQDARKLKPTDKPQVERLFKTINGQFTEHVAGYKGFNVAHRGRDAEARAKWSINELEEFFAEYVIAVYQRKRHGGLFLRGFPEMRVSPNEAYAMSMGSAGYVDCPNDPTMYYELLPIEDRKIHPYGVEIGHLYYKADILYRYRGSASPYPNGLWPIRLDPRNPLHAYFHDPADARWHILRWTHALDEHQAFTDITLREAKRLAAQRGSAPDDQKAIAQALYELQNRADDKSSWTKADRKRQTRDTHRAQAQRQDAARATPPADEGSGLHAIPDHSEADELDLSTIEGAEVWTFEPPIEESA